MVSTDRCVRLRVLLSITRVFDTATRGVQVMEELKQYFRPEFLNRLDEIIVFRQLTKSEVKEIADIMLKGVLERAKEKEIIIDLTER